jgi:predicted XRE-type DNA-binding protein
MKIDERMYKEEMMFCSKIAENLGYQNEVMFELLLHVKAEVMEKDEIINLREITQKYLKR